MVTVSHLVENIVEKKPFLEEALAKGIINYAALAETIQPEIEKELKIKVKTSAVMMALRRFSEKLEKSFVGQAPIKFKESDITIRSDLFELTISKSPSVINNVRKLYDVVDFSKGDFLTITHGLYEVTIIASRKHKSRIQKILENEETVKIVDNLSSLTVKIPIEALESAGLFYVVTKSLTWENINIVEIVSTLTEMTFILREDDVSSAFNTLKKLIQA
ncbi:MAG: hypothetical protein NTW67_00165 [Candidatus Woesearchaeota archaeon]|nr:hypothetical protein [Candidatus Woesearchaeota archaeon]